ncbi:MAG: GTPase HflX [Planctomycetes bacterium]|jgi:GTP-binding protein HflX|nr:GTPase HflX [Planctomycetota bacterium]
MKDVLKATSRDTSPVLLVLAGPPEDKELAAERHAEMHNLLDTAGREVLATAEQHPPHPHPGTYLGKGKIEELAGLVSLHKPAEVVFDVALSPRQQRNLEEALGVSVMDYDELILDIFSRGARTSEAILAVELAQMEYTRGRLRRLWTHLDRQSVGGSSGSGSGFKAGTGEKQIEMDRRLVKKRIQDLKERLAEISRRTDRTVDARSDLFRIALVGYTNAGKSTLMNALTSAGVLAEDRLFATLDTRTARLPLPRFQHAVLSDTVGFIRNLPHQLIASFHATLSEVRHADLLLHVIDAASPVMELQIAAVEEVLKTIGADQVPAVMVFNKVDVCYSKTILLAFRRRFSAHGRTAVCVSARTGEGLDELRTAIEGLIGNRLKKVEVRFAVTDGALNAFIRSRVPVIAERYRGSRAALTIEAEPGLVEQLKARGAEIA